MKSMSNILSRGVARMGFIVPVSNSNLEPDMAAIRPQGVSVHFMRAGGYDLNAVPDSDQMRKFALNSLDDVLQALGAVRPDIVVYGCTSATLSLGPDYDKDFCKRMEDYAGVPAITAAGALVESLNDLGVRKLSFASPYTEQLNQEGADFLTNSGFEVVNVTYVGSDLGNYGQGDLTPNDVLELGTRADSASAQAIVLSCTDMRAVEIIESLEERLKKPVVSSNQALMHVACKRLGLPSMVPGRISNTNV